MIISRQAEWRGQSEADGDAVGDRHGDRSRWQQAGAGRIVRIGIAADGCRRLAGPRDQRRIVADIGVGHDQRSPEHGADMIGARYRGRIPPQGLGALIGGFARKGAARALDRLFIEIEARGARGRADRRT
jgi:hypothetical protein